MLKEYRFAIQDIYYRYIAIEADSYDTAKAEFEQDYYSCEYTNVREEESETNLLMRCDECGELVDIDYMSENDGRPGMICSSCRTKAILRKGR